MLSPRNGIELYHAMTCEIDAVDTLFEICDAEFNSRKDVHSNFENASSSKRWANNYILHEVQKIAAREHILCSRHLAQIIATEIAGIWFGQSELQ
jgi:hypothetical protein